MKSVKFEMTANQCSRMNDLRTTLKVAEKEIEQDVARLNLLLQYELRKIAEGSLKRHHELTKNAYALKDEVYLAMGEAINMGFHDDLNETPDPVELEMTADGVATEYLDSGRWILDRMQEDVERYGDPRPEKPADPSRPTIRQHPMIDDYYPYLFMVDDGFF